MTPYLSIPALICATDNTAAKLRHSQQLLATTSATRIAIIEPQHPKKKLYKSLVYNKDNHTPEKFSAPMMLKSTQSTVVIRQLSNRARVKARGLCFRQPEPTQKVIFLIKYQNQKKVYQYPSRI